MRFSAVLFDLDGTLLNTIDDLADAANGMLADMGLPVLSCATIQGYVGKGTDHLVARCLEHAGAMGGPAAGAGAAPGQAEIQRGLALFAQHYRRCSGNRAVPYPGVREGLDAFRAQGVKMAVVTNKPMEFTPALLQRNGIADYFEHIVCGDTCARKKPHPMPFLHACALLGVEPAQALVVGDSINDAQAARAAGIAVLAVPYGYDGGCDVRDFEVDDIVTSIEDAARWAAHRQNTHVPQP